jgi:hypothetical protein
MMARILRACCVDNAGLAHRGADSITGDCLRQRLMVGAAEWRWPSTVGRPWLNEAPVLPHTVTL